MTRRYMAGPRKSEPWRSVLWNGVQLLILAGLVVAICAVGQGPR